MCAPQLLPRTACSVTPRAVGRQDKEAHDRLLKKAHEFTASIAAKFPAQLAGGSSAPAPPPAAPPPPIDVPGEHEAPHDAQATGVPDGHRAFSSTLTLAPPLYAGCTLSTLVVLNVDSATTILRTLCLSRRPLLRWPCSAARGGVGRLSLDLNLCDQQLAVRVALREELVHVADGRLQL